MAGVVGSSVEEKETTVFEQQKEKVRKTKLSKFFSKVVVQFTFPLAVCENSSFSTSLTYITMFRSSVFFFQGTLIAM